MRIEGIAIFPVTYAPHQEGWRDWPDETPATPSDLGPRKVPTPAGEVREPGRCGKRLHLKPPPTEARRRFFRRGAKWQSNLSNARNAERPIRSRRSSSASSASGR